MLFVVGSQVDEFNDFVSKCWDQCPIVSLFLAVATFEWVVRRSLLAMSDKSSKEVRSALGIPFDIERYESEWNAFVGETVAAYMQSANISTASEKLTWDMVKHSYKLAQALKLERSDDLSKEPSRHSVEVLFAAVRAFDIAANAHGIDLNATISR